jgi:hypothetical protein
MTGDAFADRLASLSRGERAAFIAVVYEARGWAVTQEGHRVVATPPGAGSVHPHRFVATADEATIATRDNGGPLTAADLRELLVYALDSAGRKRVCRRFFDRDCGPGDPWLSGGDGGSRVTAAPGDQPPDNASAGTDVSGDGDVGGGAPGETETASRETTIAGGGPAGGADAGPSVTDGSDGSDGDDDPTGGRDGRWSRRTLLVGAAVALVIGSIAAAAGPAFAPAGAAGTDTDTDTDTGGANTTAVGGGTDAAGTENDGRNRASFPPGIDTAGVTSAVSVAGAHAEALSGRSYRIHILHREYVDGRLRGVAEERIAVESSDRYRSSVRVVGTVGHASPLVAEESAYANGTALYVRPIGGRDTPESARFVRVTTRETTTPNRIVDRSQRYVRWYLGVEESRVVGRETRDGRVEVRIGIDGDPWPGSRNVTGEARVDERGLVRTIRRESRPVGEPSVRVVVTIRVMTEPVTVTRPAWADRGAKSPDSDPAGSTATPTPTTATARPNTTETASRRVWP